MEMTRIPIDQFEVAPRAAVEKAMREPVAITDQGRDQLVILTAEEYARLKRRDRAVYTLDDLPDEWLEAVETVRMPAGLEHLDAELG